MSALIAHTCPRPARSVLLDASVQARHPRLRTMAAALQSRGLKVRHRRLGLKLATSRLQLARVPAHSSPPRPAFALQLLGQGGGGGWGAPGQLPAPGQYCFESLQMARYETGQHFLAHEDGFPTGLARQNGFQRHATLLVYLNTTAEVGARGGQGGSCTQEGRVRGACAPQAGAPCRPQRGGWVPASRLLAVLNLQTHPTPTVDITPLPSILAAPGRRHAL